MPFYSRMYGLIVVRSCPDSLPLLSLGNPDRLGFIIDPISVTIAVQHIYPIGPTVTIE